MDPDQGLRLPTQTFGAGQPWTWFLVWSRPNWRQGSWVDRPPVTLLTFGSVPVVQMDSSAGSGRLILFPGASQTIISGVTLTRRHTHSLILTLPPARASMSGWTEPRSATGATNAAGAGGVATLLHDTTIGRRRAVLVSRGGVVDLGTGRRRHHDAAGLRDALDPGHAARASTSLVNGQSNAVNGFKDGAWHLMAQGVAWYLGALAWNVAGLAGQP